MTYTPETLLADYYEQVFRRLRMKGRSEKGHKQYLINLRHFDRFLGRPATLADLDDDTVTAFLLDRCVATSPETANKARNHTLALWRFAARKGHVATFPDVEKLKERKRIPQAWNHAQIAKLVETAYRGEMYGDGTLDSHTGDVPANLWWTGLLLVLYETGIRIGAALQLRPADVDLKSGRVFVDAEIQKQFADQSFTLTPETLAVLRQFPSGERAVLFQWCACEGTFYHHFNRLLKAAGLPTGRRCGPHRIRRTTATMAELHIGRGTATGILGHSSAHVTRAYIDTSMLPENRFAERLPRPLLAAQAREDGTIPTEAELLPKKPEAVVPVDHHVSAIILPAVIEQPDQNRLLDADAFALLAEFTETATTIQRLTISRYRTVIIRLFHEFGINRLRDIDGVAILAAMNARKSRWSVHMYWMERAAICSFLRWCVHIKKVYWLAGAVELFKSNRKSGKEGAA